MKKALLFQAIAIFIFVPSIVLAAYFAAKDARKFHHADCQWVKKIRQENLLSFETAEEARRAGYSPCRSCNPDGPAEEKQPAGERPAASGR